MKRARPKSKRHKRLNWMERGYKDFYYSVLKIPRNATKKPGDFDTSIRKIEDRDQLTLNDRERLLMILDYEFALNWIRARQFRKPDREHIFYMEDLKERYLGTIAEGKFQYSESKKTYVPSDTLTEIKMAVRELLDLYPMHLWRCFNCDRYFVLPFLRGGGRVGKSCSDSCKNELLKKKRDAPEFKAKKREYDKRYKKEMPKEEEKIERASNEIGSATALRPCNRCGEEFWSSGPGNRRCDSCTEQMNRSAIDYDFVEAGTYKDWSR